MQVLDDFTLTVPRDQWTGGTEVAGFTGSLEIYMKKYMDPCQAKIEKPLGRVLDTNDQLHFTNILENWLSYSLKCLYQQNVKDQRLDLTNFLKIYDIYLAHVIEKPNLRIPNPQYLQQFF